MSKQNEFLKRNNEYSSEVLGTKFPVTLFATEDVPIDKKSVEEIVSFTKLPNDLEQIDSNGKINKIILTPDFHKGGGSGIPVGTVFESTNIIVPKAVGNDIGCGVRVSTFNISKENFDKISQKDFDSKLRKIFFEGFRNIPATSNIRRNILNYGIDGITKDIPENLKNHPFYVYAKKVQSKYHRIEFPDELKKLETPLYKSQMQDYIFGSSKNDTISYDDQIGSIGGGNHFVEIQYVSNILDKSQSYNWNIKKNILSVMCHSGSVGIGHMVGSYYMSMAEKEWPKDKQKPNSNFYPLDIEKDIGKYYLADMYRAMNFAQVNRLAMEYMVYTALKEFIDFEIEVNSIYDLPHNYAKHNNDIVLHRKGACPSEENHPVLIPGSMGDKSYILKSQNNHESLCSACHGAGRLFARNTIHKQKKQTNFQALRVVTKVDVNSPMFQSRPDLVKEHMKALSEESPDMYKKITPIIDTVEKAKIAFSVAELTPILTIKGV